MPQGNSWDRPTGVGFGFRNFFQQLGPAARQLWNNTRSDIQNPSIGGALRTANTIAGGPTGIAANIGRNAFGGMRQQNAFNHLANNLNSMGAYQGQSPNQWMGQGALQNPSYPTPATSSPMGQSLGIPNYLGSGSTASQYTQPGMQGITSPLGGYNMQTGQSYYNGPTQGQSTEQLLPNMDLGYGQDDGGSFNYQTGEGYSSATTRQPAANAASQPSYNGNQQSARTSGNGNGTGGQWGTISMSQLESMLSAGIGSGGISAHATPGREMSEMRDARRAEGGGRPAGMSVKDYIMQ